MRRVLAGTGAGGVVGTLVAKDRTGVVLVAAVIIVVVLAACWVLNDRNRPERLALLFAAWRGMPSTRGRASRMNSSRSSLGRKRR